MSAPLKPRREAVDTGTVARMFGVDPKTVWRWEAQGVLKPAFRTPGGHRRYWRDEIEKMTGGAS